MFKDFDLLDFALLLLIIVVFTAAGFGLFAGFGANHRVDGYYISHGSNNEAAICVYAHWTWHPDEVAFCTDDMNKALDFAARANATVKP